MLEQVGSKWILTDGSTTKEFGTLKEARYWGNKHLKVGTTPNEFLSDMDKQYLMFLKNMYIKKVTYPNYPSKQVQTASDYMIETIDEQLKLRER